MDRRKVYIIYIVWSLSQINHLNSPNRASKTARRHFLTHLRSKFAIPFGLFFSKFLKLQHQNLLTVLCGYWGGTKTPYLPLTISGQWGTINYLSPPSRLLTPCLLSILSMEIEKRGYTPPQSFTMFDQNFVNMEDE